MYSRDEVKALTDKVLNMAKADAVEVNFTGGERSATRWANSNITANMVQFEQSLTLTVYNGTEAGLGDHPRVRRRGAEGDGGRRDEEGAGGARQPEPTPLTGPQEYMPVDAALPNMVDFGPGRARQRWSSRAWTICEKKGVLGSGYIPKTYQTTCNANSKGLFAYYQSAEAGLHPHLPHARRQGSGWAGITGVKDVSQIDADAAHRGRRDKALKSQKPRAMEPGRYTVILEPRANARFLSLMTGLFNAAHRGGAGRQLLQRQGNRARPSSARSCSATPSRSRATSATPSCARRRSSPTARRRSRSPGSRRASSRTLLRPRGANRQKKEPTAGHTNMSLVMEGTTSPSSR